MLKKINLCNNCVQMEFLGVCKLALNDFIQSWRGKQDKPFQ
jgi:hypothetical protein